MRYETGIRAYDVMGVVHWSLRLTASDGVQLDRSDVVLTVSGDLVGVGETDPHQWLRDLLVAVLEST